MKASPMYYDLGDDGMKTKDNFLEGAKVTQDNAVYGASDKKANFGPGDSVNGQSGKKKK